MKHLREDVEQFYRLRMIVTFKSGRVHKEIFGPFTTPTKAREIRTRISRVWNEMLTERWQNRRADNFTIESIRYTTEVLPCFGWRVESDDMYTAD